MRLLVALLLTFSGVVYADAPKTRAEYLELCRMEASLAHLIMEARHLGRSLADATVSANGDRYLEELIDIAYSLPMAKGEEAQSEQRRTFSDMVFSQCRKGIPGGMPDK